MKLTLLHDHPLPTGVLGLDATLDGQHAVAACANGALYWIDLTTGQAEAFETTHPSYASGCVLLPDERVAISAGYDGWLFWHEVETRRLIRRVQAHKFWSWQLRRSPDGQFIASTTGQYLPGGWKYEPAGEVETSVKLFEAATGALVASFAHQPPVMSCAFSPDGKHLAAGNMMGEVRVWNCATADPKPIAQWTSPDFTSWGSIKTHHYCGGIYGLAFAPDGSSLIGCGMGPMTDPMAGNGKMTWQRWNWEKGERLSQIQDGQQGAGLMEALAWFPDGSHFLMAGRQAQGNWNVAIFSATDGNLVASVDTKQRVTQARVTPDAQSLILSGARGQPARKDGVWPAWGCVQVHRIEV